MPAVSVVFTPVGRPDEGEAGVRGCEVHKGASGRFVGDAPLRTYRKCSPCLVEIEDLWIVVGPDFAGIQLYESVTKQLR